MQAYVAATLGDDFVEAPHASLAELHAASSCRTPLVLVLTSGADPTQQLLQLAKARPLGHKHGLDPV